MKKFEDYTIKEVIDMGYTIVFHGPKGQRFTKGTMLHVTEPSSEKIKNVFDYVISKEVRDLKKDIEI